MDASNIKFIIAAYTMTWIVLLGYLLRLVRKGGRARADYERMAQQRGGEKSQ
ncbi:MAG: CcmD family protein [Gemmatimonadaceae bacterium]